MDEDEHYAAVKRGFIDRYPELFQGKEPESSFGFPVGWAAVLDRLCKEVGGRLGRLALSWSLHIFTLPQDEERKVKVRASMMPHAGALKYLRRMWKEGAARSSRRCTAAS